MVQDGKVIDNIPVELEQSGSEFNLGHLSAFVQKKKCHK